MGRVNLCFILGFYMLAASCQNTRRLSIPPRSGEPIHGSEFYRKAAAYGWRERDSLAILSFERGNIPDFWGRLNTVKSKQVDTSGKSWKIRFFVTPDYFMIGGNTDWARVPLTPMAAQKVADRLECFLPTKKMVDLIHAAARIRTDPVPMYAFRDSTVTMWQHHLIIEGQRKGRKGLISGIKKDVVLCSETAMKSRTNRVAIYGWHKSDGQPIQPLYTGHVNWYVDYSHGNRFVHRIVRVNGKWMDYRDLFEHQGTRFLLSDENEKMFIRY